MSHSAAKINAEINFAETARLFTQDEVDAPVRRRRIVTQRLQGAGGAVRRVPGTDRIVRADTNPQDDGQEDVLPGGEDGVGPPSRRGRNWVYIGRKTRTGSRMGPGGAGATRGSRRVKPEPDLRAQLCPTP